MSSIQNRIAADEAAYALPPCMLLSANEARASIPLPSQHRASPRSRLDSPFPRGEGGQGVRSPLSRLAAEHRIVEGLLGDELEQRRLALLSRLDSALDRRHNLRRLRHPLAVATERLRHIGVIAADI